MTKIELQTKRDEILKTLGIASERFGERSVEYANAKEALAVLDSEIAKIDAASSDAPRRTSFVQFRKD